MAVYKNQITKYNKTRGAKKLAKIIEEKNFTLPHQAAVVEAKANYKESHKLTQRQKANSLKHNVPVKTRTQKRLEQRKISKQHNISPDVLAMFSNNMSTFDGIGASSEGWKLTGTGISIQHRCEINVDANKTYYTNNEFIKENFTEDINELYKNIPENYKLGLLIQSAPCQSWSSQGKKQLLDSKNGELTLTAINLQKKVDANVVVYENVKGQITNGKFAYFYENEDGEIIEVRTKKTKKEEKKENLTFIEKIKDDYKSLINPNYKGTVGKPFHILETLLLEDDRYNYYWQIMNTNDYGMPQNRERLIIVGIKKELDNGFSFPQIKEELDFTVEDILEPEVDEKYFYNNVAGHRIEYTNQERRKNKIHTIAKYADTMTYESTRRIYAPYVAPCITTNNYAKFFIDGRIRTLTPTEAKRIHGFREEFKLVGPMTKQNRQLGNTVSPRLYKYLFLAILQAIKVPTTTDETKRVVIKKTIINKPDMQYLNITSKKYQKYMDFLANGGRLFLEVEKYENTTDKKNKINSRKITIEITDLLPKGYRNKKQEVRRYKIISNTIASKKIVNNISYKSKKNLINPKNDVLFTWVGSKRQFTTEIHTAIDTMKPNRVNYYVDAFAGSLNFTINNIEKVNAKHYVVNDLNPILYATYKALKQNYKKVQKEYLKIRSEFSQTIPEELKNRTSIKKSDGIYYSNIRGFYIKTVDKLEIETDIYKTAAMFIWKMQHTTSGILKYRDKKLVNTSFKLNLKPNDKLKEIEYYSYILNKYDVIIENLDIFEIIKKYSHQDTFIYLDPPYLNTDVDYSFINSAEFQISLLEQTNNYRYRLYSNEDCEELYNLGIDEYFTYQNTFTRVQKDRSGKKERGEYLAFSTNENSYMRVA